MENVLTAHGYSSSSARPIARIYIGKQGNVSLLGHFDCSTESFAFLSNTASDLVFNSKVIHIILSDGSTNNHFLNPVHLL